MSSSIGTQTTLPYRDIQPEAQGGKLEITHKKPPSSKPGDYKNYTITAMETIEKELNIADGVIIIATLSGIARIFIAIAQFFWAVLNSIITACGAKSIVPVGENYYKHSLLNLFRGIVATIPIVGSLALKVRDNEQRRCTYNNELSRTTLDRVLDDKNNNVMGALKEKKFERTDLGPASAKHISDALPLKSAIGV